jgi:magnesium-transporting ATPase (P-type)
MSPAAAGRFFCMIRAIFYVTASAAVWLAEGFLFSYFLHFRPWQTVLMAIVYSGLLGMAIALLRRQVSSYRSEDTQLAVWRHLSLAPMVVAIVGSFASLPLLLIIAGLGKLVAA